MDDDEGAGPQRQLGRRWVSRWVRGLPYQVNGSLCIHLRRSWRIDKQDPGTSCGAGREIGDMGDRSRKVMQNYR